MALIKLVKGRSYTGEVKATRENPFVKCDEATAKAAVASGFFIMANSKDDVELPFTPEPESEPEPEGKPLDEMNKSELETFATYKNVDIKKAKTKADIIEAIKKALPPEELEGNITYGSPTMVELQEK